MSGKTEAHAYLARQDQAKFGEIDSEGELPDGGYRIKTKTGRVVMWSAATSAHEVHGWILEHWNSLGAEGGLCGYPTTDEQPLGDDRAKSAFQHADIYWSAATGAHEVHGAIRDKYNSLGGPNGQLRLPVTDERPIDRNRMHPGMYADNVPQLPWQRRFSVFQRGIIEWTPHMGARVHGDTTLGFVHTTFRPRVDGFRFANEFDWEPQELNPIRDRIRVATAVVLGPLGDLAAGAITDALDGAGFGLCGGMTFLALDYFKALQVLPRGDVFFGDAPVPDHSTPVGARLREQLWRRLDDSLDADADTFAELLVKQMVDATGAKEETARQFAAIKEHLDDGNPVPVGLVGTTLNPLEEHQVLAFDYDDHEDGTGTLYVYDPNLPNLWSTIRFNLNGSALGAWQSSYPGGVPDGTGPLRAFFLQQYTPRRPTVPAMQATLQVPGSAQSSQSPQVTVGRREPVRVQAFLRNVGFGSIFALAAELEAPTGVFTMESLTGAYDIPFRASSNGRTPSAAVPAAGGNHAWSGHVDLGPTITILDPETDAVFEASVGTPAEAGVGKFWLLVSYGRVEGAPRRKIATAETLTITTR